MDGYEVLRRLQADEATRAIRWSSSPPCGDDSEQRGFELGAADFIHKPIRAAVACRASAPRSTPGRPGSLRRKAQHMARMAEQGAEQLESTRRQLLQSEKMASIGQLSAGIAHEINNPVGFVASNLAAPGVTSTICSHHRRLRRRHRRPGRAAPRRGARPDAAPGYDYLQAGRARPARRIAGRRRAGPPDRRRHERLLHAGRPAGNGPTCMGLDSTLNIARNASTAAPSSSTTASCRISTASRPSSTRCS